MFFRELLRETNEGAGSQYRKHDSHRKSYNLVKT
jgi:hypothetical protein